MSDAYWQACERHARVLRELEEEEKAMQPQQQQRSEALVFKTFETPVQQPHAKDKIFTDKQGEALAYVIAELLKEIAELRTEIEVLKAGNVVEPFRKINAA